MAKPLSLPLRPVTTGPNISFSEWNVVREYGPVDPPPAAGPAFSNYALLSTAGEGRIYAGVTGNLSIRPPRSANDPPSEPILTTPLGSPLPSHVALYVHVSPLVRREPAFAARSDDVGELVGFHYRYVDPSSLTVLGASLDRAVLTPKAQAAAPSTLTRQQRIELLLAGELEVRVTAGQEIGRATTALSASGRLLGFTAVNRHGPIDPSLIYDYLREFVDNGQPVVDAFLGFLPKRWPVLLPNLSDAAVLLFTRSLLYSQNVLQTIMDRPGVKYSRVREMGDNQKELWRARLLKRTGHADAASTVPPFEFDDVDLTNLFQLEAVVEYYANLQDPWNTGATVEGQNRPRPPKLADGTANPDYVHVDFLNVRGTEASVDGTVVTLDAAADLSRVKVDHDTLELVSVDVAAAGRDRPLFQIVAKDEQAHTVTVHEAPVLTQPTSAWEIHGRPIVVVVDPFGARGNLQGASATVANGQVTLDGDQDLTRVNRYLDSVYFPDDSARASRTYRIQKVVGRTLTLDAVPMFTAGSSSWHIPAGVSGRLSTYTYNLGPDTAANPGFDHYDGALFVVSDGAVNGPIHFSSYTSRHGSGEELSSIRGNRRYLFSSLRSFFAENPNQTSAQNQRRRNGAKFRNYCFKITDPDLDDGVRDCLFYFGEHVTPDRAIPPALPGTAGKTGIRIHAGSRGSANQRATGSGSDGCVVSPRFFDLRDLLIELYRDEYERVNGEPDREVTKLLRLDLRRSQEVWDCTQDNVGPASGRLAAAQWQQKIQGTFWLVRPDERPEG